MAYHAVGAAIRAKLAHPTPIRSLVDFARVTVAEGGEERAERQVADPAVRLALEGTHAASHHVDGVLAQLRARAVGAVGAA